MEKFYSLKEASAILGVHYVTLQRWDREGKIHPLRTMTNRRRFPLSEIQRVLGVVENRKTIGYARVSSQQQKDDLQRQIDLLRANGAEAVLHDIGSGLSEKRKAYQKLQKGIIAREYGKILVAYPDRLTRFGFDTFCKFAEAFGAQVVVLQPIASGTPQEELTRDLLTLVAHFSGKLYGLRSHKYKEVLDGAKQLLVR